MIKFRENRSSIKKRNSYSVPIILFFLLISCLLGLSFKAIPTNKFQKTLQHEVAVTLKLVQIYVIDMEGNPVTDLEISDFQLFDNGKLKNLTEFENNVLTLPGKKPVNEKLKTEKAYETPAKPPPISRKFLLFFDFAFNEFAGILKARRAALHFIDNQIHPEDEVGVITYDTFRGLTLREYFTAEHEKVRRVIEGFGGKDIQGRAENIFRDYWGGKAGSDLIEKIETKTAKHQEGNYINQVKNFSKEIGDMAKALRYIPGSKHIILFSSGITNSILYGSQMPESVLMGGGVIVRGVKRGYAGLREIYEKMSEELAAANCPVYPINTAGKSVSHFKTRDSMGDYSMRQMAKISGGDYYDSISSYEEITEKIQNITSSYYVLGYYIDEKWDGKFHKIKVKVNRKGCRIFGQTGYFNPKPFTEYNELERLMHLIDLALSEKPLLQEPIHFPLITLPIYNNESNIMAITKIPWEEIKDVSGGKMEIVTLFFDDDDNITELEKTQASALKLANDVYYYTFSSLAPGDYECRMVIRNLETGKGATASSSVTILETSGIDFRLYQPLLLVSQENACFLKNSENKDEISIIDVFPFDKTKYAPVVSEIQRDISNIFVCVPYYSILDEPEIELNANLIHLETGREIIVPNLQIADTTTRGEAQRFLIKIKLPELSSGHYSLMLNAEEKKTQLRSQIEAFFIIK